MKILYHHRIASKDGQFVHVESIVRALEQRGHAVNLVGPSTADMLGYGQTSSAVSLLKRKLPKIFYEVLELAYGLFDYGRVARAFGRAVPDMLYERYNLHTLACALLRRRHRVPFLLEVNAPLLRERQQYGGLAWPGLARWTERLIWQSADAILTVTSVLADELVASGLSKEKIWVIPNAIDLARFEEAVNVEAAKQRLGLAGKRVVGFVGFVRDWHGLDQAIAWLGERGPPDVVLLLVGHGPALPGLQAEAQRRGVADRFIVTGPVPHDAVAKHVAAFDLALQPTVVPYASPLKLFEYMGMGRPIIAPDTANIREILTHGDDAWLVGPEEMPDAIDRLLADEALRARLGREARRTIERLDLTWDRNASRIEAIAEKVKKNWSERR
jgi:glycosyltransferase involved in cell wall biosynthesis